MAECHSVAARRRRQRRDLDVFSEEPVEFRRGVLDRPSRMSLVSVLGAIVFGTAATAVRVVGAA